MELSSVWRKDRLTSLLPENRSKYTLSSWTRSVVLDYGNINFDCQSFLTTTRRLLSIHFIRNSSSSFLCSSGFFPHTPLSYRKNMRTSWEVCENISLVYLFIPTSDSYFNTCSLSRQDRLLKSSRPLWISQRAIPRSLHFVWLPRPPRSTIQWAFDWMIAITDSFDVRLFDVWLDVCRGRWGNRNLFLADLCLSNCFKTWF